MHPSISDVEATGTSRMQDDECQNFTTGIDPDLFKVYWEPQTSREAKFALWLDRLAAKNREAFRETIFAAQAEEFLADHAADFEQTKIFVAKMLAAVAVAQQNAAAQWLAESKARLAAVAQQMTRETVRTERTEFQRRGVFRGRR
jgi:hypothetical protein